MIPQPPPVACGILGTESSTDNNQIPNSRERWPFTQPVSAFDGGFRSSPAQNRGGGVHDRSTGRTGQTDTETLLRNSVSTRIFRRLYFACLHALANLSVSKV
jgi:hypothetical protein